MHPRQRLHWQYRNLVSCDIAAVQETVWSIAKSIAKGGSLPGHYKEILQFIKEEGGATTSGYLAREHFGAKDICKDHAVVIQTRETLEILVGLAYLRRGRTRTKYKRPGYSTPQATTYYRLTCKEF